MKRIPLFSSLLFFAVILLAPHCAAQDLNEVVASIISRNVVDFEVVGFQIDDYGDGNLSPQYRNYLKLGKLATTQQLIKFAHHENGTLATYAILALIDHDCKEMAEVYDYVVENDRPVAWREQCETMEATLCEVLRAWFSYNSSSRGEENKYAMARKNLSAARARIFSVKNVVNRIIDYNEIYYLDYSRPYNFTQPFWTGYNYFKELARLRDKDQVVSLAQHENRALACAASWRLTQLDTATFLSIFASRLIDDRNIKTCVNGYHYTSDFSTEMYIGGRRYACDAMQHQMDSTVLYMHHYNLSLLGIVLESKQLPARFTPRIEFLAFTWNRLDALYYLKKLNDQKYYAPVKEGLLKYFLRAELQNKNNVFLRTLLSNLLDYRDNEINAAVAAKLKENQFWRDTNNAVKALMTQYCITGYE